MIEEYGVGGSLMVNNHWRMQQGFEKDRNYSENGTLD